MKRFSKTAIAAAAVLVAGPAAAQLATGSKAPVDITADGQEFTNSQCLSIWRGNVEALQDTSRMRTDVLRAYFEKGAPSPNKGSSSPGASGGSCGDLTRIEAQGAVYYATPQQRVRGDNAVYDATTSTLTITGGVVAAQGQNVMRGEKMVFNTNTGEGHMVGAQTGRNAPNRVRGVFYPKENDNQNAQNGKTPAQNSKTDGKTTAQPAPAPQRR
jgi:lipopolysaccharide export system protein LptA